MTCKTARIVFAICLAAGIAVSMEWHGLAVPQSRSLPTLVVDRAGHRAILYGGGTTSSFCDDAWELRPDPTAGYRWSKLSTTGTPTGRSCHAAVLDSIGHRMLVFGGRNVSTALGDVWALNLDDNSWTQLNPSGTPPGIRCHMQAVYSPERRSMVFFGGTTLSTQKNDVWELQLDSLKWRQLNPSGTPPSVRESHGVFLDANRLIVFGGMSAGTFLNDMWALDLTPGSETWTQLSQSGSVPSIRATFGACYDPVNRYYYTFGGFYYPPSTYYDELYVCDLNTATWTRLNPSGEPPCARRGVVGAFDPAARNFVLFGGQGYADFLNDAHYVDADYVGVEEWQPLSPPLDAPQLFAPAVSRNGITLRYSLPAPCRGSVRVLDPSGRVVRELLSGSLADEGALSWDGRDGLGATAPAGSYFIYLQTEQTGISRKFALTN